MQTAQTLRARSVGRSQTKLELVVLRFCRPYYRGSIAHVQEGFRFGNMSEAHKAEEDTCTNFFQSSVRR